MHVPVSWLAEYVALPSSLDELVSTLDDLGLVVEDVVHLGGGLDGVVVVRVEQIDAIEGADRIRLATVTDGSSAIEVVCGAWNYEVGSLVPFAPVGSVLPNGMEIARRKLRGVVSNGMLCSRSELGLGDDHEGLLVLDGEHEVGTPIATALDLAADTVLDLSIEGNRPDAHCIEGVARDLAARAEVPFAPVDPAPLAPAPTSDDAVTVRILDEDLCGRFVATVLHGVVVGPSPAWLVRRLERCGMRSINNVVDASNYVMLELGQPTHAYDLDRLAGNGLVVRRARSAERLVLLDGTELELAVDSGALGDTGEDLLICDADDTAVGLAGIMGGEATEISASTTSVVLEAAWFEPMGIARSATRHRLRTEASVRFERGCDPSACERASARFVELLAESVPSLTVAATHDVRGTLREPPVLAVDERALEARLGVAIPLAEATRLLEALGFAVRPTGSGIEVTAPSGRPDVRDAPFGVADVAEEVARLHGYSAITPRVPHWPQPGGLPPAVVVRRRVREALVGLGALEAWTATMVALADAELVADDRDRVRVTNPMAASEPALRSSLLPGLLHALRHNVERRQGDVALFEVGNVFSHPAHADVPRVERAGGGGGDLLKVPSETERIGVVLGRRDDDARSAVAAWRTVADALRLEDVWLAPGDAAPHGVHETRFAVLTDRATATVLGIVGEVDPRVVARAVPGLEEGRRIGWLDLDLSALADPARASRRTDVATLPSRFPSSDVDLALVVADSVHVEDVKRALREAAGELCETVRCFDAYRGPGVPEGHRSLALRVRLCAQDRTLSERELGDVRTAMIESARGRLDAVLR